MNTEETEGGSEEHTHPEQGISSRVRQDKVEPPFQKVRNTVPTPRPSVPPAPKLFDQCRISQRFSSNGHLAHTVCHPKRSPLDKSFLEGGSAGFASVATRSMNTRIRILSTTSQKTEIREQISVLLEYPLIKADSTTSESMKMNKSTPLSRSANVSRATIGASISTGIIWVFELATVS